MIKADNSYELVLITKDGKEDMLEKIVKFIEGLGGSASKKESMGKKYFSYPIKKESEGYYYDWVISMAKKHIKEFRKYLDYNEDVLRYLLLQE